MAIASPSPPTFSASFCCSRAESPAFFARFARNRTQALTRRLAVSSQLNSSPSDAGGSVSPDNGDLNYEFFHGFSAERRRKGSPVFVTLPIDAVSTNGQLRRRKAMVQSFRALAASGVEGVVMEVWWGLVERHQPRVYNWQGYLEIVALAQKFKLKVRAVFAFHQYGTGPGDPLWIPLPHWVLDEVEIDPDITYTDRFGRRSIEYISLGCDTLPVLRGRSPIQAYTDLMRSFRESFEPFIGAVITGIQVGMGPGGELRYPSCPSHKLTWSWRTRELGEFQCYDKYMLASLDACARQVGMTQWGTGGPYGAGNLMQDPEKTNFFKSDTGSWNTPYGKFFLEWYSGMLLLHGERICREVVSIFGHTEVETSAKVAGIYWHYITQSHPSELTAGYYNTWTRDGYLPIVRLFARYGFTLCSSCFEMQDLRERQMNPASSPEGFLQQLLFDARVCDVPLEGENSASNLDDASYNQVIKMSKFYSEGLEKPSFSFNFVRMDKNMFEYQNWVRFTRFVRQMSNTSNIFRAKLAYGGDIHQFLTSSSDAKAGIAFAYC
ncbi:hypothetical protein UlMin_002612 [Ulmus minor]